MLILCPRGCCCFPSEKAASRCLADCIYPATSEPAGQVPGHSRPSLHQTVCSWGQEALLSFPWDPATGGKPEHKATHILTGDKSTVPGRGTREYLSTHKVTIEPLSGAGDHIKRTASPISTSFLVTVPSSTRGGGYLRKGTGKGWGPTWETKASLGLRTDLARH